MHKSIRIVVAIATLSFSVIAVSQQTAYRWTDENGVVHISESAPAGVNAEVIQLQASPPAASAPATNPAPVAQANTTNAPVQPELAAEKSQIAISEMSLGELDQRCEAARQKKIAPLKQAEIEKCKSQPRNDPAWCERHNADFGEGGRNVNGTMRPRMFDNLPECVDALQERNRRTSR